MQRQLDVVRQLQKQADVARARAAADAAAAAAAAAPRPKVPKPSAPVHLAADVAADGVFGLGEGNPPLAGGSVRLVAARALLRAGGSLSLAGMRQNIDGHDLTFFRALLAARAGVGFSGSVADFDLTGGPALLVLVDDAHAEGRHAVASLAFVAGPRLAVTLAGPLALVVAADLDVAVTDEKVTAGTARVAEFVRPSVEVSLGLSWRTGR